MSEQARELTQDALDKIKDVVESPYFLKRTADGKLVGLNQLQAVNELIFKNNTGDIYNYGELPDKETFFGILNDNEGSISLGIVGLENDSFFFNWESFTPIREGANDYVDFEAYDKEIEEKFGLKTTTMVALTAIEQEHVDNFIDHVNFEPLQDLIQIFPKDTVLMQSRDVVSGDLYRNQVLNPDTFVDTYEDILSPYSVNSISVVPPVVGAKVYTLDELREGLKGDDVYTVTMYYSDKIGESRYALEGTPAELLNKIKHVDSELGNSRTPKFTNFISMSNFTNTSIDLPEGKAVEIIDSINEILEYFHLFTEY